MKYKERKKLKFKTKYRVAVICACGLSVRKVILFQKEYVYKLYVSMDESELKQVIKDFKSEYKKKEYKNKTEEINYKKY